MRVEIACTPLRRLRGLLGRKEYPDILLIAPCNDVHTFGMSREIDVAFVTSDGLVVESHKNIGACKRIRCKSAAVTLERISSQAEWFESGDRVELKKLIERAMESEGKTS